MEVSLIATVHDPDNHLYHMTEEALPALKKLYRAILLACSAQTHPETLALFRRSEVLFYREEGQAGRERLGLVRKEALRRGLEAFPTCHFHLCDFDRALHWITFYPEEMRRALADIIAHDFLIMGRTARAFATHPPVQAETERLANLVFSLAFRQEMDIAGGARGISRQAAEIVLAHSKENGLGIDAEWPLILRRFPQMHLGFLRYEGLEFETGDGREKEIARAGGPERWKKDVLGRPEAWVHRLKIACEIAEAAVRMADGE
ncbi:MAG: hypothetical protein ACUVV0_12980 [Anaerolineae bacterium]